MKTSSSVVSASIGRIISGITVVLLFCWSDAAQAQGDGPRFYWKGLNGTNAIPLIFSSQSGNANPSDASNTVIPGADFSATMSLAGYARMVPVFKRSAMIAVMLPMGRISGDLSLYGKSYTTTARGYGDPMLQFNINVIGPKAIMNIPDMLRYKPGFSVDLITSLAIPIGEYDNTSPINIGQNRWYGCVGAPIVWQLGSWVPGRRTTFECLPAIWFFTDNTDFVGKTMETKPMFQLEAHITRDFAERVWGSLDLISISGGEATIDGVTGSELSNIGLGGTIGYQVNENMQLNISYSSTINDSQPEDLSMDGFRFTVMYGWHKLVEGMRRLKGNE
jgi:hypothetical protein